MDKKDTDKGHHTLEVHDSFIDVGEIISRLKGKAAVKEKDNE